MKKKLDLTQGPILYKLILVAIPTLLISLVQMAYNLTDLFWVGKVYTMGLDENVAISSVGNGGYFMWFGFGLIMIAKIGTSIKVSQSAGMNDYNKVSSYANSGFVLMSIFALLWMIVGVFFHEQFISLFNLQDINIINGSHTYIFYVGLATFSFFLTNLFSGVFNGLGLTFYTFLIVSIGLVFNIILDPFFILDSFTLFGLEFSGLGLSVKGAAIATAVSQTVVLSVYLIIFLTRKTSVILNPFKYATKGQIKDIFGLGIYIGLQSMFFTTIAIFIGRMLAPYGKRILAVQRLGSQIEALAWMVASGFQIAMASFVGQNFGAKQHERIKKGYITAMSIMVPYGLFINVIMFVFASNIMSIFLVDPETIKIGTMYLEILSISQLFMIVELTTQGAFNGIGKTKIPSMISVVGNSLRLPFAYILNIYLAYSGIWYAISYSSILKGVVIVVWFVFYLKKQHNLKKSL